MFSKFLAAVRFLTILPVPGARGTDKNALAGSLPFFPLIGLGIGMLAAGFTAIAWSWFPAPVAAVLTVLFLLAISGGLHMDGLADTADGFFSARPREQMLAIMRDSRSGVMGVIAIVVILALKTTAFYGMEAAIRLPAILLSPLAGRCALVILMASLPYARPEGGLASLFYSRSSRWSAAWAILLLGVIFWLAAGGAGVAVALLLLISMALFAWYCKKTINGATGDTLGAGCELTETATALLFCATPLQNFMELKILNVTPWLG